MQWYVQRWAIDIGLFNALIRKSSGGLCRIILIYIRYMCNYSASEAINLCSRYVEKSTKCSEQKYASSFRELSKL